MKTFQKCFKTELKLKVMLMLTEIDLHRLIWYCFKCYNNTFSAKTLLQVFVLQD